MRGYGQLGHDDTHDKLVFTRVEAQQFGHAKIMSAAAGKCHSTAVTQHRDLYTWGEKFGLVPACIPTHLFQGACVGRCRSLPPMHALAFAMGTHSRLGSAVESSCTTASTHTTGCAYMMMLGDLVQQLVEMCVSWPEGRAGELEGVVQLLGGSRAMAIE